MADTSDTRRRVLRWAELTQRQAATTLTNRLSKATPKVTGGMERARVRRDTSAGSVYRTKLTQPAGGSGRPDDLPERIDVGKQVVIVPRRARALRFRAGGAIVFARRVLWNRSRRSQGFWSKTVNEQEWRRALDEAAAGRPLP